MGIYIPNMDMPKEKKISLTIFPDGRVYKHQGDLLRGYGKDCIPWKAFPVPPHGRLGDLDALVRQFPYLDNFDTGNITMTMKGIRNRIYTAPTIIPAEEGK